MIQIDVRIEGVEKTRAYLAGRSKQVRYAAALSLTRTAQDVQREIPAALDKALDRPTKFTKSGTFVMRADRDRLQAVVGFKDRQAEYLKYQIAGGTRNGGARGIKLPTKIPLDEFGNIKKGTIAALIKAAEEGKFGLQVQRRIGAGGAGKKLRKGVKYGGLFFGKPLHHPTWPVGIYRRVLPTAGQKGALIPIIVFPTTTAKYKPRFDFQGLAQRTVRAVWSRNFDAALAEALRTAR